jgi:hypothetical protein
MNEILLAAAVASASHIGLVGLWQVRYALGILNKLFAWLCTLLEWSVICCRVVGQLSCGLLGGNEGVEEKRCQSNPLR